MSRSRRFSTVRRVDGRLVRVVVIVGAFVLALFFLSGFLSTLGGLLFLLDLSADGFNLLHVEGRSILFTHEGKLSSLTSHVSLLNATLFLVLLLEHEEGLDFNVLLGLRPLADGIGLLAGGRDAELDEGLEASEEPVFDELSQDDLELSSGGVNLLSEGVGQVQDDLNELEEDNLSSLDVNKVLTDGLLSPVFHELGHVSLFTLASGALIDLGIIGNIGLHLRAGHDLLVYDSFTFGFLSGAGHFGVINLLLTLGVAFLPGSDLGVDGNEERVGLDVSSKVFVSKFVTESLAGSEVLLNDLDEVFSLELLLIEDVTLLE